MAGADDGAWVSAGELADYAFCPRSHWYSRTRPGTPMPRESARSSTRGHAFHTRELTAVQARSDHRWAYAAALLAGVLLAALAVLALGGY